MRVKRGFTLIELLIVIVIISITASIALLSFGDFGASRKARLTAENFSAYIQLLQQRALFEAGTLKIIFYNNGYETKRLLEGHNWQSMTNRLFRWQSFPKNIVVKFHNTDNKAIIITSSGEISPFQLNFGTTSQPDLYTLIPDPNNSLIIKNN